MSIQIASSFADSHWPGVLMWVSSIVAIILLPHTVSVAIHELGHAVGALITRSRIYEIVVGTIEPGGRGRWLFGVKLRFVWAVCQSGGYIVCLPKSQAFYRVRWFIVLVLGPVFSLTYLAFLCWLYLKFESSPSAWMNHVLRGLIIFELFGSAGYLFPRAVTVAGTPGGTDMLQIWWLLTRKSSPAENEIQRAWYEVHYLTEAGKTDEAQPWIQRLKEEAFTERPLPAQIGWANAFLAYGEFDFARKLAVRILDDPEAAKIPGLIFNATDTLACAAVYALDAAEAPAAIEAIKRVVSEDPRNVTLQGTLGGLYYLTGDLERAEVILRGVIASSKAPLDIGICAAFLSRIADLKGDATLSAQLARTATRHTGTHQLVKRLLHSNNAAENAQRK